MAELRILQDVITNEAIYPYTVSEAVIDENGNSVIETIKSDLSEVAITHEVVLTKSSDILTEYPTSGYINADTGELVENRTYVCYYFTMPKTGAVWFDTQEVWGQIAVYDGNIFDSTALVDIGSLSRNTLPYAENKMTVNEGMIVAICNNTSYDFSFHYENGKALSDKQMQYISDVLNPVSKNGENEVTVRNAEFLDEVIINACDGNYIDGYGITGSSSVGFVYEKLSNRYNLYIVPIKPNTTYTVIGTREEGNIVFARLAVSNRLMNTNEFFDGYVYDAPTPVGNKIVKTFTSAEDAKYLYLYGINYDTNARTQFWQVAEGTLSDFTTDKYNYSVGIPNEKLKFEITTKALPKIKIVPKSTTMFEVHVLDETSGNYVIHRFIHSYYSDNLPYGNGLTKDVVGADVWYSDYVIANENEHILQGNTNFIHYIGNMSGHDGHVGAGHGCCVAEWENFWADGKRFDPSTLKETIECTTFRFQEKVLHYLNDSAKSKELYPSDYSAHAIPTLDNDGNPIVTGIEYLDAEWSVNNRITMRNRFDVMLDEVKFTQCHAGMLCGFYPYFNNVVINNKDYIWNEVYSEDYKNANTSDSGKTFTYTDKSGSGVTFNTGGTLAVSADEVILFGDKYRVTKRIVQNNPTRHDKTNVLMWTPPSGDGRLKAYFMPCVCTQSTESVSNGMAVETFNKGDILDLMVCQELEVSI